FNFLILPYDADDGWKRLLRDLYVNPFGPADFHKNPCYDLFEDKLILNGGNSFTIANDNNFWQSNKVRSNPIREMALNYFVRPSANVNDIENYIRTLSIQVNNAIPNKDPFS